MDVQGKGIPEMYYYGEFANYKIMVLEFLGPSLKDLYNISGRRFSDRTLMKLAIQLVERMETLHDGGWLHQDVKPENFVVGVTKEGVKTLYALDFGTSSQWIEEGGTHREKGPATKIVGTARYSSLNNHLGYLQSRRDDLESVGYVLLYWIRGKLPWQGIKQDDQRKKWRMVRKIKTSISPRELCKGSNSVYYEFIRSVKRIKYDQRPNYEFLKKLFRDELARLPPAEKVWDWSNESAYISHTCHEIDPQLGRYTNDKAIGPLKRKMERNRTAAKKGAKRKSQIGASPLWPQNQQLVSLQQMSYASH